MEQENNPMGFLDFTIEDLKTADEKIRKSGRSDRDKRICVCGHSVKVHESFDGGFVACTPSRIDCRCKEIRPVIKVEDVRLFIRKTMGPGPEHALSRGMLASIERGHVIEWIAPRQCDRCGKEGPISPTAITKSGTVVYDQDTGLNALLCQDCRAGV
jgi:hypothetical protein